MSDCIRKILLVDDEDAILFAFSIMLKGSDIDVHTAHTLDEAIALLQKNNYIVVIVDLRLSGTVNFEGFDLISSVTDTKKECKIIVMTAYGDEKIKEIVFSLGADFYLEKPVSPQKIKEIIASMGVY